MKRWIVCYDIPVSRRRAWRRVVRLLEGYGERVQLSVFELLLTEGEFDRLVSRLRGILDPGADRLVMYPLTETARSRVVSLGDVRGYELPDIVVL